MDTRNLDTLCGFCAGSGRRAIPRGSWISAPVCLDCGGSGYLVLSEDGERLLTFVEHHVGRLVRQEIAELRAELLHTSASHPESPPHAA